MRRRKVLATLAGTGIATIAGCSGGDNESTDGNNGSSGNSTTTPAGSGAGDTGSCVPATDNLASLLPSGGNRFEKGREASTGLSIGTDTYIVGRYETTDGAMVDMLIAEYSSTDAASSSVSAVRSASENAVMGTFVDANYIVAVDAPSPEIGRALVQESEVSCVGQLSFGNGDTTSTSPEESFELGEVIWSQTGGNAARSNSVNVESVTASSPSSYTISFGMTPSQAPIAPVITQNALIGSSQIYNIEDGSVVDELPATSVQSPVLYNGIIVIATEDGRIRGIDAQSREERWSYLPQDSVVGLAAAEGVVLGRVGRTNLVAVDIESGDELWSGDAQNIYGATGGLVFVGDGATTTALSLSDGSVAYELNDEVSLTSPAGSLYISEGTVRKHNASDGSNVWGNSPLNDAPEPLAVDDQHVYTAPSFRGRIIAQGISNGDRVWRSLRDNGFGGMTVDSDRIYLGTDNRIFALSKSNGEETARYAVGARDRLLVGDGVLVAFNGGSEATVLTNQ